MSRCLALVVLLWLCSACSSCPPEWADSVGFSEGYQYAAASVGQLTVDVDPVNLALTRAARRLADALDLDVEGRLSVVRSGGTLFVEARSSGPDGGVEVEQLASLELVELARCGARTHARVRLALSR